MSADAVQEHSSKARVQRDRCTGLRAELAAVLGTTRRVALTQCVNSPFAIIK
jgi:hypothetical protein